jgi:hypothetical protein
MAVTMTGERTDQPQREDLNKARTTDGEHKPKLGQRGDRRQSRDHCHARSVNDGLDGKHEQ